MKLYVKTMHLSVVVFFVMSFMVTLKFVPHEQSLYYSLLSILNIIAFLGLAVFLGKPKVSHAPILLILYSLLITYFLQFFLVLYEPRIAGFDMWIDDFVADPTIVLRYFEAVTVGFCSFCLGSIFSILFVRKKPRSLTSKVPYYPSKYFITLTALIVFLAVLSGSVMAIFGTSSMAGDSVALPYRLSGIVFYTRVDVIPSLLILGIFLADINKRSRFVIFFLCLLVLHGLSDMLLRSSRGFLLQIVIMTTMMFVFSGTLNATRVKALGWSIAFTVIVLPIVGLARGLRDNGIVGDGFGIFGAISTFLTYESEILFTTLLNAMFFLLVRFTGAVSLLQVIGRDPDFVLYRLLEPGFTVGDYMTYEVMGWPIDQAMGYAPSTFGYFYLLSGIQALAIGMVILVIGVMVVWSLILSLSNFFKKKFIISFLISIGKQ